MRVHSLKTVKSPSSTQYIMQKNRLIMNEKLEKMYLLKVIMQRFHQNNTVKKFIISSNEIIFDLVILGWS